MSLGRIKMFVLEFPKRRLKYSKQTERENHILRMHDWKTFEDERCVNLDMYGANFTTFNSISLRKTKTEKTDIRCFISVHRYFIFRKKRSSIFVRKNKYRRKHIRNRFQFSVTMALKMSKIPAQSCYPTNNVTGRLFEKYADSQTVQHRSLDLNWHVSRIIFHPRAFVSKGLFYKGLSQIFHKSFPYTHILLESWVDQTQYRWWLFFKTTKNAYIVTRRQTLIAFLVLPKLVGKKPSSAAFLIEIERMNKVMLYGLWANQAQCFNGD